MIAALEGTRGKRLVITGHSLGSALATLAVPEAHALQLTGLHYNQASPQVGNERFADYVGTADNCLPPTPTIPTVRLVNTNDPVPTSPGEHLGYRHAGTAVCIENVDYGGRDGINNHNPCCSYSYAIFHPERPENPLFDRCSKWGTPA